MHVPTHDPTQRAAQTHTPHMLCVCMVHGACACAYASASALCIVHCGCACACACIFVPSNDVISRYNRSPRSRLLPGGGCYAHIRADHDVVSMHLCVTWSESVYGVYVVCSACCMLCILCVCCCMVCILCMVCIYCVCCVYCVCCESMHVQRESMCCIVCVAYAAVCFTRPYVPETPSA